MNATITVYVVLALVFGALLPWFLFFFCFLQTGPVHTPHPPAQEGRLTLGVSDSGVNSDSGWAVP